MKIGIIGVNSLLGYELANKLIKKGYEPILYYHLDKSLCAHLPNLNKVSRIFKEKDFDFIFLISAKRIYEDFNSGTQELWDGNIQLPYKIINKFTNSTIIFSSSIFIYEDSKFAIVENSNIKPKTLYNETKIAGEIMVKFAKKYQIIRFSSIYGFHQNIKTFLPIIIQNAMLNKEIYLFGKGERKQNYIHVSDAAEYMIRSMKLNHSNILLGVDIKSYSNKEVAKIIQKYTPCSIKYKGIDNSLSVEYNNIVTQNLLNWAPKTTFETGISEIITTHKYNFNSLQSIE
ncbi:MAG: NAD(P)-dependent oxidoreductase [Bacteroidetes bacterium]|nr:NAD(P)-dependent oxidoreductase [Bacteroidota bacterium]